MNTRKGWKFSRLIKALYLPATILLLIILSNNAYSQMSNSNNINSYIQELKSQNVGNRQAATLDLMAIGKDAQSAVPALIQALKDPDSGVRRNSALALGRAELASTEVIDALISVILNDSYNGARSNAVGSLGRLQEISPPSELVMTILTDALQDEDERVRKTAVIVLGHVGSKAKAAVPSLIKASQLGDTAMRERAVFALGKIGEASPEVFSALTEALKSDVRNIHLHAIRALGEIKPVSLDSVAILTKVLEEQDITARKLAMTGLGNFGTDAQIAVSALTAAIEDKDVTVSKTAAYTLKKIQDVQVDT